MTNAIRDRVKGNLTPEAVTEAQEAWLGVRAALLITGAHRLEASRLAMLNGMADGRSIKDAAMLTLYEPGVPAMTFAEFEAMRLVWRAWAEDADSLALVVAAREMIDMVAGGETTNRQRARSAFRAALGAGKTLDEATRAGLAVLA